MFTSDLGQVVIGPSDVLDQSKFEMRSFISPSARVMVSFSNVGFLTSTTRIR